MGERFVLVHGAWHGGWCWEGVARELEAAGHEVETPTMPGMAPGDDRARVEFKDYVESLDGHLVLERLPAYAPELNPVEYIWGYLKQRELPNLCLHSIAQVASFARNRLKSMQRRPKLISAFRQQAHLAF